MKSSRIDDLTGEVMLVQTIKHTCVENVLEAKNDRKKLGEYYWVFNNTCMPTFDPKCVNKLLDRLGVKAEVFRCVTESFEKTVMDGDLKPSLKISLQDNEVLRRHYTTFSKVEHYGEFPMVKINGVVYYGPTTFNSIASFVCVLVIMVPSSISPRGASRDGAAILVAAADGRNTRAILVEPRQRNGDHRASQTKWRCR